MGRRLRLGGGRIGRGEVRNASMLRAFTGILIDSVADIPSFKSLECLNAFRKAKLDGLKAAWLCKPVIGTLQFQNGAISMHTTARIAEGNGGFNSKMVRFQAVQLKYITC